MTIFLFSIHPATASATTELSTITTDEGLSNGQIIAITFGTLTLIVSIVGSIIVPVCFEYHKKKKEQQKNKSSIDVGMSHFDKFQQ